MKTLGIQCSLAAALLLFVAVAPVDADDDWSTYWKNGTRIESEDGQFKLKLGGRIMADFTETSSNDFDLDGGSEFRRARLFVSGTVYGRYEFKAQYDFAGGDADAKDLYVGLIKLPYIGGIRVGHFKEPFGLEELTSSKYIGFLERSISNEAFAPSRNMGLMLHNSVKEDRLTWAVGAFQDSDGFGESLGNEWNFTGRLTGLPVYQDEGKRLLHVGLAASKRSPVDDNARFRSRPEAHLAPRFVDTSSFFSDGVDLLGLELATVQGPLWAQAEWMQASVDTATSGADLSGYNVQAGYYLTGEHRNYKTSGAVFDRLKPKNPFLEGGGSGAWEIAARYSTLDLIDGSITGGDLENLSLGINWYPNSATRVMLDYGTSDKKGTGDAEFVLLRFQVDF